MLFRRKIRSLALAMWLATPSVVAAQPAGPPPGGPPTDGPPPQERRPAGPRGGAVGRPGGPGPLMEALDTDHDGVLSAEEIRRAPESLRALDRDRDGQIEGSELRARPAGRAVRNRPGGGAAGGPGELGPPPGGPDVFGPPPGGPGGRGRGPEVGDVMPPFVRQQLRLDADQTRKIEELESDVRAKLNRILSRERMRDFDRILRQGPGGPRRGGPPGGPGGPVDDDSPPVRPGRPDEP